MDINTGTDVEIYGSRETIRTELIEFAQKYLDLQTVDLTKTSFVSYIINVLSVLASNQLFYSSAVYSEGFLLTANLTDSVYNLARWIGYQIPFATASTADVSFRLPLNFKDTNVTFKYPYDYQVKAGDVIFTLDDTFKTNDAVISAGDQGVTVTVVNNRSVTIRDALGFTTQVVINTDDAQNPYAVYALPFRQQQTNLSLEQIPADLELFQFYIKRLTVSGQVSDTEIYLITVDESIFPYTYVIDSDTGQSATINNVTEIDSYDKFIRVFDESTRANSKWELSSEGIFTLQPGEKKYIATPFPDELDLAFGNGVIGAQPIPGDWMFAFISTTEGQNGNSIPGSISTGDKLLYTSTTSDPNNPNRNITKSQRITFDVTNLASATGGLDTPTLTEIKANAISNLTSKDRLVSEVDYNEFSLIVPEIPIEEGSVPILKRSDLKINEIDVFSQLIYDNPDNDAGAEIVPTRNLIFPVDTTGYVPIDSTAYPLGNFFIPRYSVVNVSPEGSTIDIDLTEDNISFQTLFDIQMDLDTNTAQYLYTIDEVNITTAVASDTNPANSFIYIPSVDISSTVIYSSSTVVTLDFLANVNSVQGGPVTSYTAKLWPDFDDEPVLPNLINTILDGSGNIIGFTFKDTDFDNYPTGSINFKLKLIDNSDPLVPDEIAIYQFATIIKQDLSEFMLSDITLDTSINKYLIHNVPCVLSEYLEQSDFNIKDFEVSAIQAFISNVQINDHKMLTDFVNLKFSDTTGPLTNMKYNESDVEIISYTQSSVPVPPPGSPLVSYVINGTEGGVWAGNQNSIARWNGSTWIISLPRINETAVINNIFNSSDPLNGSKIVFSGEEWVDPVFDIPFAVTAHIIKDPTSPISNSTIVSTIKSNLIDEFSSKFGSDKDMDRSEIISVIRGVSGVQYVKLFDPVIDIRFKYNLSDLTVDQLFDYTPQMSAFTADTISITVITE